MDATDAAQAPAKHHQRVLQVALAPAAVALRITDDVLRNLLVAAFQVVSEPDLPVLLQQQRGLHEIMAENLAAEWLAPRQMRQVAILHERFRADNRVVAPIISK